MENDEVITCLVLLLLEDRPVVSSGVVDDGEKVNVALDRGGVHRPAEVHMKQFEWGCGTGVFG